MTIRIWHNRKPVTGFERWRCSFSGDQFASVSVRGYALVVSWRGQA